MTATVLTREACEMFTGSESFTRWSGLFPKMLITDGAKFVAESGGAYWLMDAIASHQRDALKVPALAQFQIWELTVATDKSAVLTCREDSGAPPVKAILGQTNLWT